MQQINNNQQPQSPAFTPLNPAEQNMGKGAQTEAQQKSMRERQENIGRRMGQNVVNPRLAQNKRGENSQKQKSPVSNLVSKQIKSSAAKWIIGATTGSMGTAGLLGWLIS